MQTLEEENRQVLNLLQALLGAVSANFRAVSINCQDTIVLNVVLGEDRAEDREEIDDIEFEFLAQQSRPVSVSTEVLVSSRPIEELRLPGRLVFLRREPASVSP